MKLPDPDLRSNRQKRLRANADYIAKLQKKERSAMNERLIDPMGIPIAANGQPMPPPPFQALANFYLNMVPLMLQREPAKAACDVAEEAWDVSKRVFSHLGVQFKEEAAQDKPSA
jgi:hypothetical protein